MSGWLKDLQAKIDKAEPGYGTKVLVQLFFTYGFFCKSLSYALVMDSWTPIMKNLLGVGAGEANDLYVVVRSPWAMKPLWAVLSDTFPINGYRKRYNILWALLVSIFAITVTAFFTPTGESAPQLVAFLLFLFVLGTAIVDSMTQARYTELMKAAGDASIVSFVWFLINVGGFLGAYNLLLSKNDWFGDVWVHKILLVIALPISLPMVYPAALNWLGERQAKAKCEPNYTAIKSNTSIFVLSLITAGVAVGGVVIQLLTNPITLFDVTARWINGIYYMSGAALILICCQLCLPRSIALPAIYMFMCKALYLNIGFLMQYYYIADDTCIPGNPNFGNDYYQTVSSYGGTVASLCGVVIFDRTIQFWNVRAAFWVTTGVNMFTTIFDLMIMERWNQNLFGYFPWTNPTDKSQVVDQMFFIIGAQAIDRLVDMLDSLPQTVLIGKLCPKNMEAQVFAILAALSNFGNSVAGVNGSIVAAVLGLKLVPGANQGDPWTCENPTILFGIHAMGWCKIIATFILPLTTIPFTWCCLPNRRLDEDMLDESEGTEEEQVVEMANLGGDAGLALSGDAPTIGLFNRSTTSILANPKGPAKSDQADGWAASAKTSLLWGRGGDKGSMLM